MQRETKDRERKAKIFVIQKEKSNSSTK